MTSAACAKYRKDHLPPSHLITHLDLTIELDDSQTQVTAISTIIQAQQSNQLRLDGEQLTLLSVKVDGLDWPHYQLTEHSLLLSELPEQFELSLVTQINPISNTALEGLYKSGGAFCTQCEAEGFRRITYYLDRPDVLAIFTTRIIADKAHYPYLLGNGNNVGSGDLPGGKHWVSWVDPYPKPAYLFALVAGDFDLLADEFITRSGRSITLHVFVDKGNLERSHHAMTSLKNAMRWDETRFDLEYDLDIYMIVAVDFFNMGAMENKGLNIFNAKFVLASESTATDADYLGIESVIGHEYFHNWTGNRVTCRDWFQLSLKEGLTVFRDQEFSSDLGSRAVNRIHNVRLIRGPQFAEDASPMSHPIRPEKVIEMNNFYTLTVYEKGSEVIRMIHTLLGEVAFQQGMALYFERHDGTAATCDDFVAAMEDASGIDLTQFRYWYSQSGTPHLSVTSAYDEKAQKYHLTIKQKTKPTKDQAKKQALHIPINMALYDPSGSSVPLIINGKAVESVLSLKEREQTFVFEQLKQKPVVSLLREFSAPVSLSYDYSDEELIFLMRHETNAFARWDAGQTLLANYIKRGLLACQQAHLDVKQPLLPQAVIDGFAAVLSNASLDDDFIAEMLTLPSHNEVSGWFDSVDIDAIYEVLTSIKTQLALTLEPMLSQAYQRLASSVYAIDHASIARRSLRNTALSYLAFCPTGDEMVRQHYQQAHNMTDVMAAMTAANLAQLPCRNALLDDFSDKWHHDGLVMDKWFMLQGTNPADNALDTIKLAMNHRAFSLHNPNRTRSLIGSFLNHNPRQFHQLTGEGYQFAGEILTQLNHINPQVASRLIDPLLKFEKYPEPRRGLLESQLKQLRALDGLAKDLYEKIEKALAK